jgi:hypothetical protein
LSILRIMGKNHLFSTVKIKWGKENSFSCGKNVV